MVFGMRRYQVDLIFSTFSSTKARKTSGWNLKITQLKKKNQLPNFHFWIPCYFSRVYGGFSGNFGADFSSPMCFLSENAWSASSRSKINCFLQCPVLVCMYYIRELQLSFPRWLFQTIMINMSNVPVPSVWRGRTSFLSHIGRCCPKNAEWLGIRLPKPWYQQWAPPIKWIKMVVSMNHSFILLMEEIPNNHLGCINLQNPILNGMTYQNLNWLPGFLPSTVSFNHSAVFSQGTLASSAPELFFCRCNVSRRFEGLRGSHQNASEIVT